MTDPVLTHGTRQGEGKRTKFQQVLDLVREVHAISDRIHIHMNEQESVPLMDVVLLESKVAKLMKLVQVTK